jgi:hypothetical protein
MMHTLTKIVDGVEYRVHHNGDWSGEAIVVVPGPVGGRIEFKLPGMLLRACGREAALQEAVAAIEEIPL